jgi:hypothetical protein
VDVVVTEAMISLGTDKNASFPKNDPLPEMPSSVFRSKSHLITGAAMSPSAGG